MVVEANQTRRLRVDDKFKLCWLQYRQVPRLSSTFHPSGCGDGDLPGTHRESLYSYAYTLPDLPFYSRNVTDVIGLEPSPKLLTLARAMKHPGLPLVQFIAGSAEVIPLENATVDTVLTTWTLCSIPDAAYALREMRRVLKRAGICYSSNMVGHLIRMWCGGRIG